MLVGVFVGAILGSIPGLLICNVHDTQAHRKYEQEFFAVHAVPAFHKVQDEDHDKDYYEDYFEGVDFMHTQATKYADARLDATYLVWPLICTTATGGLVGLFASRKRKNWRFLLT